MRRILVLLSIALTALGSLALPSAAEVSAEGPMPVIVSPLEGSVQPVEWRGPVTVDFTDAPAAEYWLIVECAKGGLNLSFPTTEETTTRSFQTSYLSGDCSVRLGRGTEEATPVHFRVTPPPALTVSTPSLDHTTFYPRVRDGYLDSVTTAVDVNRRYTAAIEVLDSHGNAVRSESFGWREAGQLRWTWDGREDDGRLAWPGSYQLRIRVATWGDESKTLRSSVITVSTRQVWERTYVSRQGHQATPAASAGCSAWTSAYFRKGFMRCRGGDHARLTYGFSVPASARNVVLGIAGAWSSTDQSGSGMLRRWSTRPSSTLVRVNTQVNGTRAYEVTRATIGYDYLRTY